MTSSFISSKIIYVIVPTVKKSIIYEVRANNYESLEYYFYVKVLLNFMPKGGTTCPELSIFS